MTRAAIAAHLNGLAKRADLLAQDRLTEAASHIDAGQDTDAITPLITQALLYMGEARGYRNTLYDLANKGEIDEKPRPAKLSTA